MRYQIRIKPYSRMISYSNTQTKTLYDTKIITLNKAYTYSLTTLYIAKEKIL